MFSRAFKCFFIDLVSRFRVRIWDPSAAINQRPTTAPVLRALVSRPVVAGQDLRIGRAFDDDASAARACPEMWQSLGISGAPRNCPLEEGFRLDRINPIQ